MTETSENHQLFSICEGLRTSGGSILIGESVPVIVLTSGSIDTLFFTLILAEHAHTDYAGVYEIPFQLNNKELKYYIRMTKRKFSERLKEHKTDIKYSKLSTTLSTLYSNGEIESIDFDNAGIIIRHTNPHKAKIRESLEILTRRNQVCNDNLSYIIPSAWIEYLKTVIMFK